MPFSRKAFSLFSSSSSSTSPSESPNAGKIYGGGRRLTRVRKLRHVGDDEVDLQHTNFQPFVVDERSKSMPVSPDNYKISGSRSCHWSKSAEPQPLPLPELNSAPKQNLLTIVQGDASNPAVIRDPSYQTPVQMTNPVHRRSSTPTYRRRCFTQDQNAEGVEENFRLNVSARSAPGSGFTSPNLSPKRYNSVDLFRPTFHQASSPSDISLDRRAGCPIQLSSARVTQSADHSPLSSPTPQNPVNRSWNHQNGAVHSHHKSLPESPAGWPESNNVHPLPLPPGGSQQPQLPTSHNNMDQPDVQSVKGQWQKGRLLGRGTYGSVYEATNRETGALCAMKEVDLNPDDPKSAECIKQLEQEIRVLRQLKHPNIVQYYGSETMEDTFCIYLEYVHPGSINKYVRDHGGAMTESIVRNFTRHIVSGLAYLHSTKTVHRDIKGANLLVDAWGIVKLADFGLAKHLSACATDLSLKGSPHWMAPEVMQAMLRKDSNPELACAIDIWSLGCTVIEMYTGQPPWSGLDGVKAMFSALNKSPPVPETLSSEGKDFLRCCFQRKPADRPTALLLLEHPFLSNTSSREHSATISGCSEDFSRMKLHSPKDPTNFSKELNLLSPGTSSRQAKSLCNGETSHRSHSVTCDYGATSHHSPRSTLEILPCISSSELNLSSLAAGSSSNPNSNLLPGPEIISTAYVFNCRIQGKEIPNL
ncbi:PREDICTED: mitogen-activated protein kinase kinase kinase YODA-like [Nicotiana attenuata]|uniref:mitogen-activated protein kinase kinase kinase n=1 Tax=Nicotiana attenuata TaxID=49451 RepID=A0A1J6KB96_NICAT|nr:PREDICTED: mitogen-activated protein kinase kinase kinase YODA-like [Nicotiana attenuata]OIT22232.1 mitogen-activated protein kinase kinase kinase yoda [Nicotiana attenuata]